MKTIVVCGYGPGISDAVARKFAKEDFAVALVARNAVRLAAGVAALTAAGATAKAYPTDLGDPDAVTAMIAQVHAELGPVTVLHYNATPTGAGDLLTATPAQVRAALDVGVVGLIAAVQAALPDLQAQPESAVLVTGGGLAYFDAKLDGSAVAWNAMGLALAKAAQHKLVGLLAEKLRKDGIYVGEVVVLSAVKGTTTLGNANLAPAVVATKFWELYALRAERSVQIA